MSAVVGLSYEDGVARIVLRRPERGNALDEPTAAALRAAVGEAAALPGLRAVLLRGKGPRFCVGGDVRAFAAQGDGTEAYIGRVVDDLHAAIRALTAMPAPTVAAVQGSAAGAGLSLALACDVVVAAESARFAFAYPALGFTPDGGASWSLPRQVGERRALDIALLNRPVPAPEAVHIGLVTRCVPDDRLDAEADALVAALGAGPTSALVRTRALVRGSVDRDLDNHLDAERAELLASVRSADGRAGLAAFGSGAPAVFTGFLRGCPGLQESDSCGAGPE
ncbi:enoyl-CoA hydratase/isomerase family protein [Streptomyces sp. NPDC002758]